MAQKNRHHSSPGTSGRDQSTWFDKLSDGRKDLFCVAILYALVLALFHDIVLKNMLFSTQADSAAVLALDHALQHLRANDTPNPLWVPYIFGGMPLIGFLMSNFDVSYLQHAVQLIGKVLFFFSSDGWYVLHYLLGGVFMFLLARAWKFSHLPSLIAAITFMLSPYAAGLAVTGHGSKLMALSYIPMLFLLTRTMLERRDVLSLGLLCVAVGTQFLTNHVQMVYYSLMLIGLYFLYDAILNFKESRILIAKKTALFVIAIAVGFAIAAYIYFPVYEYAQYSIRGSGEAGAAGGLNYDYATNWSFHPLEMFNLLIPSFFGFSTPYYWGWMPFNDASVYFGIVPIILAVIALVYKRNSATWFLTIVAVLTLLVSFGKHLPLLYDLMFRYLPYFNKFRAPSMILHLLPFTFGLLAAYGYTALTELLDRLKDPDLAVVRKRLTIVIATVGALLAIGFLTNDTVYEMMPAWMFQKPDNDQLSQILQQQYRLPAGRALEEARRLRFDILWKDYIKFALLSGASIGLVILYLKRKVKTTTFGFGLALVLAIDLFMIDTKFIDPKPQSDVQRTFAMDATVQLIKSDTTLYRIYPVGNLFQDNSWMYHIVQSIGGYSPAKLKIYQETLDSAGLHPPKLPLNMNVINMLNVKYVVVPGRLPETDMQVIGVDQEKQTITYENQHALPRAWFVKTILTARSKSEVFAHLNAPDFDPRRTAILEKEPSIVPAAAESTSASIREYRAERISLGVYCSEASLLVLSEVYYPAGWKAFVDGTEAEIYKTNYILRSVVVPAGNHAVEFIFNPTATRLGYVTSNAAWGVAAVLILLGTYRHPWVRKKLTKKDKNASPPSI